MHRRIGTTGRRIAAGSAALLSAALAGCASAPIEAGADQGFEEESAPQGALPADEAFPENWQGFTYEVAEGDNEGRRVRIERRGGRGEGEFQLVRQVEGESSPSRVDHLRREPDGAVVLLETESRDRDVISRYDPPLVLMPAALEPGEAAEQRLTLTIHPIDDPKKEKDRGEATNRIRFAAEQQVSLPSGARKAARVESVFEAKLRLAKVVTTTDSWFEPGAGLIAERYDEQATALGVVVSQRRHLWLAILE